jgi:hypothetical protein
MTHNPIRRLIHRWRDPSRRGQSLVEFAITLPLMLLIVMGTIDLGRAYFATINLASAVKEGAFFGARNPGCPTNDTTGCIAPRTVEGRVDRELDGVTLSDLTVRCFEPGTTDLSGPGMSMTDCEDGDMYYVSATSPFALITPVISQLVGNSLDLRASATSVVLTNFTTAGSDTVEVGGPSPSVAPNNCVVPDFRNGTKLNQAQNVWQNVAGFTTSVTTVGPGGQNITWQSLPPFTQGPCDTTTIIVSNSPQATATPTPTPVPTATPSATPTPSGSPSGSPTPTATPTPTPQPTPQMCTVPQLVTSPRIRVTQAQATWVNAGFTAANFIVTRPPNDDYRVRSQSITAGQLRACLTTQITVGS